MVADTFFLFGRFVNNLRLSSILSSVFPLPFVILYSSCNDNGRSRLPLIDTLNSLIVSICFCKLSKFVLMCGSPNLKPLSSIILKILKRIITHLSS